MINLKYALYFAWTLALASMFGSLFFSEVMHFPPCKLCWFQRIGLYPLVVILAVGILREDRAVTRYALPFSIFGLLTAIYHNLIYYNWIPEALAPCTEDVSCSEKQIEWFGFVTIPMLSLIGFVVLTALLTWIHKSFKKVEAP